MPSMTGSQILIQSLINEGVDQVFGYAGATICSLLDEMKQASHSLAHTLLLWG